MLLPSIFGENLFDDWMDDFGFRDNHSQRFRMLIKHCMVNMQRT